MLSLDQLLKSSFEEFKKLKSNRISTQANLQSIFEIFSNRCQQYHNSPAQNLSDLKTVKSKKAKGDIFELFCQRYLLRIKGFDQVWLLKELPEELKGNLKLPRGAKDYGIDLVGLKDNQYSAIQCKFKAQKSPIKVQNHIIYPAVNWKELSTFNELCNASGPWNQRLTMTTARYVKRLGGIKDPRDKSICIGTFKALTEEKWEKLIGQTNTPPIESIPMLSPEELRQKRLLFFNTC